MRPSFIVLASAVLVLAPLEAAAPDGCGPVDWWDDPSIPACPAGHRTVLPETYPSLAYVVSDRPLFATPSASAFPETVALAVLEAAGPRTPLLYLPVRQETFARIERRLATVPQAALRQRWKSSLRHVTLGAARDGDTSLTWQTDFWLAFQGRTGLPVFRQLPRYERGSDLVYRALTQKAQECPLFAVGDPIPPPRESRPPPKDYYEEVMPDVGGNVLGLPGGRMLVGDQQSPWFTASLVPSPSQAVRIPTSYMQVGHVDDIAKVLPWRVPMRCETTIALASPARALELLAAEPRAPFFEFFSNVAEENAPPERLSYRLDTFPASKLCEAMKDYFDRRSAQRQVTALGAPAPGAPAPAFDCAALTNGHVAEALQSDEYLAAVNRLVQGQMDRSQAALREALGADTGGACPRGVRFVALPAIFLGAPAERLPVKGGKPKTLADLEKRYRLRHRSLVSLTPNPTNTLSVERTVLSPHPQNGIFARYLRGTYERMGLSVRFVDTWDYSHRGAGNLHCATKSIPVCRR